MGFLRKKFRDTALQNIKLLRLDLCHGPSGITTCNKRVIVASMLLISRHNPLKRASVIVNAGRTVTSFFCSSSFIRTLPSWKLIALWADAAKKVNRRIWLFLRKALSILWTISTALRGQNKHQTALWATSRI